MGRKKNLTKEQKAERKRERRSMLLRGVLAHETRSIRAMTVAVLAVACVALAFTQLGFAGIGLLGEFNAYAVTLLIPVALGALLLGTVWGTLVGVFAGAVMYTHALVMPLDYYELLFVTPVSSIVMLGLSGLLLGLLFAFALRNNPSRVKRCVYIAIVCIFVSWLYSLSFTIAAITVLTLDIANTLPHDYTQQQLTSIVEPRVAGLARHLGDSGQQAWTDGVLMAFVCIVADMVASWAKARAGKMGLRTVFAAWLCAVVAVAFMVTSGMSFVAITQGELSEAKRDMSGELDYLSKQLEEGDSHAKALFDLIDSVGIDLASLSKENLDKLQRSLSFDTLLEGYDKESDGTILFLADMEDLDKENNGDADGTILLTDDDHFTLYSNVKDIAGNDFYNAIKHSAKTNTLQRVVFDKSYGMSFDEFLNGGGITQSEIVYVLARQTEFYFIAIIYPTSKVFVARAAVMGWTTASVFVLLAAIFTMVFLLLNRVIVRRIDETNGVLGRITEGDLDARVEVRNTREFSSLSDGVNETVDALKGWISEAETRMDAELATAKEIQESALPRIFPPYPDILEFDIYASMNAAREVGGDFYDFFLIGDSAPGAGKLGFIIADVSGKGVPAALFMMKAKTQLRDYLESGMNVGEAVENANRQLCDGNDAGMFVTVWVGVLDYASGHVDYVNAGHNPPLLWQYRADEDDEHATDALPEGGERPAEKTPHHGAWRWLTEKSGMPLGLFDGFPYESFSLECQPGETFLLYTDGVTEAMSTQGELYGENRLKALADSNVELHPRELVNTVRHDVADHATGAEQSDDITILALEVGVPPEITATLVVKADCAELPRVNEFIHSELNRRLCPMRVQSQIDIAVEELFVNVAHYAYPEATEDNPGTARISYTYSAEPPSITVQIADDGIPYNPLAKPDAVTPDDVMEVPIGGLGILMAKRSVDEMTYAYEDGSNVVTIMKKW